MAETERESYVYVRLKRPEGYEDVHPELLVADANIHSAFEPEIVASHPEEAVAQRLLDVVEKAKAVASHAPRSSAQIDADWDALRTALSSMEKTNGL